MKAGPMYLQRADRQKTRTYGDVSFRDGHFVVKAEPMVLQTAKRLFPGSNSYRMDRTEVRFPANKRMVGDLNWLMMRFPMRVKCQKEFDDFLQGATEHAGRRAFNRKLKGTAEPARFKGKLKPFQRQGVTFLIQNERTLLAHGLGLGKTVTSLAAACKVNEFPVLIVVESHVQRQWIRQTNRFCDVPRADVSGRKEWVQGHDAVPESAGLVHQIQGTKPYELPNTPFIVIHYGLLAAWKEKLQAIAPRVIIFDETHALRHANTKKYSAAVDISQGARYAWGLTGTPIFNYGGEIWAVINILDYHALGDWESFTREWATGYGQKMVEDPKALGQYLREEGLMLVVTKEEVQSQLPAKRRIVHDVESDHGAFAKMVEEAVRLAHGYDSIKDWHEKGQAKRQIDNEVRKASGVSKAPFVAEFVRGLIQAGEKPLICAHHHEVHDILMANLKEYAVVRSSGLESQEEKDHAVTEFSAGRAQAFILALRSSSGLDGLQGQGTCVVFAELDWSPAVHSQAEDRLHRMGMKEDMESLLCYYMVSGEGIDETMQERLGLKTAQFTGLMGTKAQTSKDEILANQAAQRHLDGVIERLKKDFKPMPKPAAIDSVQLEDERLAAKPTEAPAA